MLAHALDYAIRGWRVFPLRHKKQPLISAWQEHATCNMQSIREWWEKFPDAQIGIATGRESKLFVLDVDGQEGRATLEAFLEKHGPFPEKPPLVRTPRGDGFHLYFSCPSSGLPSTTSKLGPHLDTRGDGGYVVAPPSPKAHELGRPYVWCREGVPPPPPAWIVNYLCGPMRQTRGKSVPASEWLGLVREETPEGTRNNRLARLTGHLLGKRLNVEVARELLWMWNSTKCRPPIGRREFDRTVDSIAKREERRRAQQRRRAG